MTKPITLQLDACTVVAQRNGDTIDFVVRSCADGAEPFTLIGPEFQRILHAWNQLTMQRTIERAREHAVQALPPPPPPKPNALTRQFAWLNADVTGVARGN
jgi:hypothetical protein